MFNGSALTGRLSEQRGVNQEATLLGGPVQRGVARHQLQPQLALVSVATYWKAQYRDHMGQEHRPMA
jgi:hypothetical protein